MIKRTRPAEQLRAMVQVRIDSQPEVQRRTCLDPRGVPVVGAVQRYELDAQGRNWDIKDLEHGQGLERTFRAIVDGLREVYDLGYDASGRDAG